MEDKDAPCASPCRKIVPVAVLVAVSLLLPLFFNAYVFSEGPGTAFTVTAYVASAALTLFVLTLSCRIRTLGFILLPVILTCALGCWYVYHVSGAFLTGAVTASILETDMNEASAYLTFGNISFVVVALALVVGGILAGHKLIATKTSLILLGVSLVVFGVFAGVSYPLGKAWQKQNQHVIGCKMITHGMMWPVYDTKSVCSNVREYYRCAPQLYAGIMALPSGYAAPAQGAEPEEQDIIVAFMVGESVRAKSLQINGYERETTPRLAEWVQKDQLVSFRNTCSFGVLTRISVIGLLTDAGIEDRTPKHRPWVDLLVQDGVETASLLAVSGAVDSLIARLSKDCRHTYPVDPGDVHGGHVHTATVETFRKALGDLASASRSFFLLYDTGVHGPYISLPENKRFLPDDVKHGTGADPEKLRNSYDNALLEVDWELAVLMQALEETGRPAVMVFASDHGEALGEEGLYFHGVLLDPVYRPAIMVWCSTAYKEKYPERYAALKSNADKAVSHDHIMHTVLSLCGVRRGLYCEELDLTRPGIRETPVPEDVSKLEQVVLPDSAQ